MKTLFLITMTIFLSSFSGLQTDTKTHPDPRLYDVLSQSEINEMLDKNPFLIEYYNYFLDYSFKIIEQPKGKSVKLPVVVIPDVENFNILAVQKKQKLQRSWDNQTYYSIEGTNKVLVFISEREFTQRLNERIGR
jgi:hypothetical protein